MWALVATFSTLGLVVAVSLALYLAYRKRILEEWDTMRINGLKRRYALVKQQRHTYTLQHNGVHSNPKSSWGRIL